MNTLPSSRNVRDYRSYTLDIKGAPLYFRSFGEGQTVMLIHGFGEDGTVWDTLLPYLPDHFRIIIPDLPGSGRSALPGREFTISIDELADRLSALLQLEKKPPPLPPLLIGHSLGGYITLSLAERYPEALSGFLLFHSTAYADSEEKIALRQKSMDFILRQGAAAFIRQSTPNLFAPGFREVHPDIVAGFIQNQSGFSPDALLWYIQAMMHRPDRRKVLQESTIPIGFIIGQQDGAVPAEQSIAQAALPRLSYTQLLPSTGHMGMLECPEACGIFLEKFLTECVLLR